MEKYELLPAQLLYEGTITEANFFQPSLLPESTILWTHELTFWEKLKHQTLSRKEIREIGFPMSPQLIKRGRYIANGTLECALYAQQYGVAMNVAGGTHHSYSYKGAGFCVLNDIAIAANYLLKQDLAQQILVIDLDVHQGDGTAQIFQQEPRVFTFSMHGAKNYPARKQQSDWDIGLPDKTEDAVYLQTLRSTLPRLLEQVQPDFIFYLSGVDIIASDKLGRLSVSIDGCKERDKIVFKACKEATLPVAVSMGGGYSKRLAHIIEAHANTFRVAQDIFF